MGFGTSFVVGNYAYVGTGYNPNTPTPPRLNTIWRYTPAAIPSGPTGYDSAYGGWKQMADFIGIGRSGAVGFTVGNYGYIGSGTPDGFTPLSDFYQYDPSANSWSQIASLGDGTTNYPRFNAAAFGFDTVGYVMTGTDNVYTFGDVWSYSPTTASWTQHVTMPGSQRYGALTWVYGATGGKQYGYLLTGYTPGSQWAQGNACYDFWKFDPTAAEGAGWIRLRDIYNTSPGTYDDSYTNIIRYFSAGFVIKGTTSGDKGYITTGTNGTNYNYTWEYDFATDLWAEKTPYEGGAMQGACGFTVQNRGFVVTGINGSAGNSYCKEFFPNQIYNQYD